MSSLNTSINGPSIKSSYAGVVNGPALSSSSPTYAQWALFTVQAPLANAFQDNGNKESVLKVQDTGDGELSELNEDFSEGRIQYAFVKVKDPNSGLPKYILIAWCGGGVPERTKGYFTSHTAAVSKILHGYHVQITARSDADLEPESIMRKVADASGAKYSAGSASGGASAPAPPPVKTKPVFTPTTSSATRNPLVTARSRRDNNVDDDGWGADAPPVTRSQVEKVESAYKPTKVNMAELTSNKDESTRSTPSARQDAGDVVRGGYQPVGKIDIAAIRAQAKEKADDRPAPVKGSYEPVGKVDIAAIRAKAQSKPQESQREETQEQDEPEQSRPVADRASAFSQPAASERLTSLPKPKVANKFGGASSFTGTKPPAPGGLGFGGPATPAPPPVGAASRTFADQGGKTPAQLWAEKKAKERGTDVGSVASSSTPAAVASQNSGGNEWKSGYSGKSWAPVQTSGSFGRPEAGAISAENTGEAPREIEEQPTASSGGVSALKDRFKDAAPMGAGAAPSIPRREAEPEPEPEAEPTPPPVPDTSRPSGGFALPGLPSRPPPADEEEEREVEDADYREEPRDASPPRVAIPVSRGPQTLDEPEDARSPPPVAPSQIEVPREKDLADEKEQEEQSRGAAEAVAQQNFEPEETDAAQADQGGHRAVVQYDYEKAEDNEIELLEGEYVTDIDMIDEGWWMGTNAKGHRGLFPCNYVELVEEDDAPPPPAPAPVAREPSPPPPAAAANPVPPPPAPAAAARPSAGPTATAIYDYEAGEDNEISFPEDAKITNIEFPDEDWWAGEYKGKKGLFPANYVELDQ
ncbi:uncharacterized protein F5Z01DRAFT_149049 [Emericellopsis atlantica]|uniref:Actin binding protein n=1 Tax=Emericellopsis atlantica TaxID=2614577 RepID=A0A9P8CNK2_9HYPO|nr:uncharacterized protein F5Z01DRAFT_149049 [Emericellopsis atlantica]KAG9253603.1 hypothetical protein F5Z01DRAFT_149049 [Emericellopsis atlantica]